MPEFAYTFTEFDEVDPVFGLTRDEDKISVNLMVQYAAPFGFENYAIQTMLGFSRSDSNIEYYNTESITAGVFLNYSF
jgi:hypothetical protein